MTLPGSMKFKAYYLTKKDGKNWLDVQEMDEASIEELSYYEDKNLIPENHVCIGMYFESVSGYLAPTYSSIKLNMKVKGTAEIGRTYGFIQRTQLWVEDLDRSKYTLENMGNFEYPTPTWSSGESNYIKSEYDENGNIKKGTHYLGYSYGNSVLIIGGELTITKTPIDEDGNTKINYDFSKNEYNVTFKLTPTLTTSATITGVTVKITDTLPVGMTYVPGSCEYDDPDVTVNEDGTTTLVWYIYDVSSQEAITEITYQAHLDENLSNGDQLESTVIIAEVPETDSEGNKTYYIGNTSTINSYTTGIQIINLSNYSLYKTTETPVIEINGVIHYKITLNNKTDEPIEDFQLLDILPYNGDNRGTNYNGTYTVQEIVITQTNTQTGTAIENDNLTLYITSDESVRSGVTAKDEDLGKTSIWEEVNPSSAICEELTAYAVIGEIEPREQLEVDIYLQTDGNKPYDLYKNAATAQIDTNTEQMETPIITVQDIKRELFGYVWRDLNGDGVISDGDEYINNVEVQIFKVTKDGTYEPATDIDGNTIEATKTGEDENGVGGYYYFEDMVIGNYVVYINYGEAGYEITEKQVGTNPEINSKFNETGYTDTIETLNSVEFPVITESYVNYGICPQEASITITKVASEDTKEVLEGAEFSLYKYIGNNSSSWNEKLIDTENVDTTEWELVGEKISGEDGIFSYEDLQIIYEYRLVETKAPEGRLVSSGQWKIEFIYGDYDENDSSIYNINGTLVRITAIGNPPAFALEQTTLQKVTSMIGITEAKGLLLPNKYIYEMPTSGGTINKTIKNTGLALAILGIIMLLRRRSLVRKNNYKTRGKISKADNKKVKIDNRNRVEREEKVKPSEVKNPNNCEIKSSENNSKLEKENLDEMRSKISNIKEKQDWLFKYYKYRNK